jgi:hypothetical protein
MENIVRVELVGYKGVNGDFFILEELEMAGGKNSCMMMYEEGRFLDWAYPQFFWKCIKDCLTKRNVYFVECETLANVQAMLASKRQMEQKFQCQVNLHQLSTVERQILEMKKKKM